VVVMGSPRDGGIGLSSRMCTSMQSKPRANNLRAAILRGEAENAPCEPVEFAEPFQTERRSFRL
jgi:hypothetical protein